METFNEIKNHLKKDKVLKKIIVSTTIDWNNKPNKDIYLELLNSITSQQLSTKVAQVIWDRFVNLFPKKYPDANLLLKLTTEELRFVGFSKQKISYLKNIANFSIEKSLDFKTLNNLTNEDFINYITEIKGVGKWTAEMILIFSLKRTNVLPIGDLGIQQAFKMAYKLEYINKKEMFFKMQNIAELWAPYKTIASLYLWQWKNNKKAELDLK